MTVFEDAWAFMAPHEFNHQKNFTNIPGDPGGATMWGITLNTLQGAGSVYDLNGDGVVDVTDLKLVTEEQAKVFYASRYWSSPDIPILPYSRVAYKLFDMAVNLGPARAIMYLQEVANTFGGLQLLVDGRLGPMTAARIAALDEQRVLDGLVRVLCDHYTTWVASDPHDREQFLAGLLNRARSLP